MPKTEQSPFDAGGFYERKRIATFVTADARTHYTAGEVLDLIDNILEHTVTE